MELSKDTTGFIHDIIYQDDLVNSVHVISVSYCVKHYDDSLFDHYNIVFPDNLSRAVTKRKSEFLAGRIVAKMALKQMGIIDFTLHVGEHRQPLWPQGIVGSISHTTDQAMCALSDQKHNHGIGVDIENWLDLEVAHSIKGTLINSSEEILLNQLNMPFERALTVVFSTKESVFKALYSDVKHYFGFEAARVIKFDQYCCEVELTENLAPNLAQAGQRYTIAYEVFGDFVITTLVIKLSSG